MTNKQEQKMITVVFYAACLFIAACIVIGYIQDRRQHNENETGELLFSQQTVR